MREVQQIETISEIEIDAVAGGMPDYYFICQPGYGGFAWLDWSTGGGYCDLVDVAAWNEIINDQSFDRNGIY